MTALFYKTSKKLNSDFLCFIICRCLQNMVCNINLYTKTKGSRLQMLMAKSMSFLASWAWSFDGSVEYRDLNEAIVRGLKKEECDLIYGQPDVKQCHILPWQIKSNREEL